MKEKTKAYQVRMGHTDQEMLKWRAQQMGVSIGKYIANLQASMELRVKRAIKNNVALKIMNEENAITPEIENKIILAILDHDQYFRPENQLEEAFKRIAKEADRASLPSRIYTPRISYPGDGTAMMKMTGEEAEAFFAEKQAEFDKKKTAGLIVGTPEWEERERARIKGGTDEETD